ncbi:MAG TPA: hypothetical protein VFZ16_14670 [Hyphomicrobiaceae bacterium]|nr:hypothetical protein [Hyphomicrobiaceae bacterium]
MPDINGDVQDRLLDALRNHILCGDKNVRVYQSEDRSLDLIASAAEKARDVTSALTRRYPYSLTQDGLADVEPNQPEVVATVNTDGVLYVVFASNKEISIRHEIDRELVARALKAGNDELAETLRQSHEILAISIERRHAFDVVAVHKNFNFIEVRVDTFANEERSLRVHEINDAHHRIIQKFTEITDRPYLKRQMNLYPSIRNLLKIDDGNDGAKVRITKFGYVGSSGIARDERKPHGDVRSDPTHRAAYQANGADDESITPYDLEAQFPGVTIIGQPDIVLALHGTEAIGRSAHPVLDELTISKCIYESEFSKIMGAVYERIV